jgi:uncharacterized protein (UPF0332 family)
VASRESLAKQCRFDPREFIRLANELATRDTDQICLRTAVNRAYYGVFLAIRDRLNVKKKGWEVHKEVIDRLREKHQTLGDQLDQMHKARTTADYDLDGSQGLAFWKNEWKRIHPVLNRILAYIEKPD